LAGGFLQGAAIQLRHQKSFVAVSALERLTHAHFAGAVVVVPGIVHEIDAAVDGGVDQSNGILFGERRLSKVVAAHADHGNVHSGLAQDAIRNVAASFDGCHLSLLLAGCNRTQNYGRDSLHKRSSFHNCLAALG